MVCRNVKHYIVLNVMFFIYSLVSVLGKMAARENEVNIRFLVYYGSSLVVMGIYALFWQQIIKKLSLMTAYANRAVVIIWGLLWSCVFFGDTITYGKIAGIFLIIVGIVLFAQSEGGCSK